MEATLGWALVGAQGGQRRFVEQVLACLDDVALGAKRRHVGEFVYVKQTQWWGWEQRGEVRVLDGEDFEGSFRGSREWRLGEVSLLLHEARGDCPRHLPWQHCTRPQRDPTREVSSVPSKRMVRLVRNSRSSQHENHRSSELRS